MGLNQYYQIIKTSVHKTQFYINHASPLQKRKNVVESGFFFRKEYEIIKSHYNSKKQY